MRNATIAVLLSGCSLINATAEFGEVQDGGAPDGSPDAGSMDGGRIGDAGNDGGSDDGGSGDSGCAGECTPGETETGTNACGNEAERTCGTDCVWMSYVLAESIDTCDYCDDDPDGFREREAGFASAAEDRDLAVDVTTVGDAFGTCFGTSCQIDLAAGDGVGGTFVPEAVVLGYGGGQVGLDMAATAQGADPGLGWAFVAYVDPAPTPLLGAQSDFGVNLAANGFAVEWNVVGTDTVRIRRLDATGTDPILDEAATGDGLAGPNGSMATQRPSITWTPDDTATPADETTVTVEYACPATPTCDPIGCGGTTGTPCGFTLRPGDRIQYGVVASSTTAFPAHFRLYDSTVRLTELCPP